MLSHPDSPFVLELPGLFPALNIGQNAVYFRSVRVFQLPLNWNRILTLKRLLAYLVEVDDNCFDHPHLFTLAEPYAPNFKLLHLDLTRVFGNHWRQFPGTDWQSLKHLALKCDDVDIVGELYNSRMSFPQLESLHADGGSGVTNYALILIALLKTFGQSLEKLTTMLPEWVDMDGICDDLS